MLWEVRKKERGDMKRGQEGERTSKALRSN